MARVFASSPIVPKIFAIFHLLDAHDRMINILAKFSLLAPGLDKHLERTLESFQLHLIQDPLKLSILGFFNIERKLGGLIMWNLM
ncbi:uncharacterized protein Dwil_GK28048 [Drosophila willistoni]|uniref:Uncharacterized protein n=1 Tax=Drosophila willistoni TaxID=7260 RepID=A0A0Q9WQP5_DROWI|nr:uncharacterized protein Dwil_GK28048 [Drosophila willistoni]